MRTINVNLKDLYQLLIAECRYGYSRNNHLMPEGAYEHVKKYLPIMLEEDKEFAINTAKQLCEECISDELIMFSDGIDDEFGSRQAAINFIRWLLEFINNDGDISDDIVDVTSENYWEPYNIQTFKDNVAKDDEPRYTILKINYENTIKEGYERSGVDPKDVEIAVGKKLTKNNVLDYLFREILELKDEESITYRRWRSKTGDSTKFIFDDRKEAYYITGGDC